MKCWTSFPRPDGRRLLQMADGGITALRLPRRTRANSVAVAQSTTGSWTPPRLLRRIIEDEPADQDFLDRI